MTTAVVFDYGFGNVRSMVRALANLGVDTTLTSDYRQALEAEGLVVPGVGAFAACMKGLKKVGGDRVIYDRVRAGRPVLGVCVGEQILFEHGLEHGAHADGVGLIGGSVDLLDADVVPHMGWDTVEAAPGSQLLRGVEQERFYFVHSYAAMAVTQPDTSRFGIDLSDDPEHVIWCRYGRSRFVAAYERGALAATQFHPEKSGDAGAQLLQNWIATL
jgi:glutamine amidotransferase